MRDTLIMELSRRDIRWTRDERGYSLAELMIVLVIVGILTMLAIPRFAGMMNRAYAVEAKDQLRYVVMLQDAHFLEYGEYTADPGVLGFDQQKLIADGGSARYRIRIETIGKTDFIALAESTVDFDGDGQLNVWRVQSNGKIDELVPD